MPRTPVKKSNGTKALATTGRATKKVARKKKPGRPAKASQYEIDERRKQVIRLRMRGLGYRAIAKVLGVGHMTVKRDLEAVREENAKRVTRFEQEQTIGECLSVFEEIELKAWEQFDAMPLGNAHGAKYLAEIREARDRQIKLLTDVGLIRKEPNKVDVTVNTDALQHWTPEAQDIVAMAIIKTKLQAPAEPRPDRVIEAHVSEPEEKESGGNGQTAQPQRAAANS